MTCSSKVCAGCPHLKINLGDGVMSMVLPYCGAEEEQYIVPHSAGITPDGKQWKVTYHRVPEFCSNPDKTPGSRAAPVKDHEVRYYDRRP